MPRPAPKIPIRQVNIRVPDAAIERLRYAMTILPVPVTQGAVINRGIELYIAEAEKMKENHDG